MARFQDEPTQDSDNSSNDMFLDVIRLAKTPSAPQPPYTTTAQLPERLRDPVRRRSQLHTSQVLILGFALMILIGTVLLRLPIASVAPGSITWSEAFFTATSAITVTGLVVLNTANDFSFFGQVVILILLQVGGVGFVSFSVLLFRLVGRRVTLNERFLIRQTVGIQETGSAVQLAIFVLGITLTLEAIGAFLLWLRWRTLLPEDEAIWYAIFHAVSSYCNAGFDLFAGTDRGVLFGFGADAYSLAVMGILIILGSFGIAVHYDIGTYFRDRSLSLNTRITLWLTLVLTVVGLMVMLLDRKLYQEVLAHLSFGEQFVVSLFTIISARTAGLTILPLENLGESTQLIILLWMFIGGAPASMAGGVSSSTVGVLLIAVIATAKGRSAAVGFERTLPAETIAKAVAIMTVSTILVALVTLTIALLHGGNIFVEGFEVVSAFSNTGYSLGITANLSDIERFLIAFTMFWGRLGPLTIVVALAESAQPALVGYPEEPVIL
jgi:trk system potassium uptake protein TrkH